MSASATAAATTGPPPSTTTTTTPPPRPAPSLNGGSLANPAALSFQEVIARLQAYWAATAGCALWQPHNSEVGAGTMNPATFLRVLGPEPWAVAYPEPSVRPDDSRYGSNPNRLQQHTQFQVILKPDPGNPQELFLGSLEALGVDTRRHDVRFVEDNWENPALGAWGLGWEVWLDGQEVTQFTYFQQVGGAALPVPAVEVTYGLERIVATLQGATHFQDIKFTPGTPTAPSLSYGEMLLQSEFEWSCYNLEAADVGAQRVAFAGHAAEAGRLLDAGLPIPAYGQLLKMSHAFNVMDARGAVSVSDRAGSFAAMRGMARRVAALWTARRAELGHPLLKKKGEVDGGGAAPPAPPPPPPAPAGSGPYPSAPAPFVLEIGVEELPPDDADAGVAQLREKIPALLAKARLAHGPVSVAATPRRLVVTVADLAPSASDAAERVRGPPAKAAYGPDGAPTKALLGFCAKNGLDPATGVSLEADAKGVEYVWGVAASVGAPAADALEEALPALLASLAFGRTMRWAAGGPAFSRPVRWLVALHGGRALGLSGLGVPAAGSTTKGLRSGPDAPLLPVPDAASYAGVLRDAGITLSAAEREAAIAAGAASAAAAVGGSVPAGPMTASLLAETARLTEAPLPLLGSFDPAFLALPRDVLVMVMKKHQRYFPVEDGKAPPSSTTTPSAPPPLLPHFVLVANGGIDPAAVIAGNEAVLTARFEDAKFFYEADCARRLEDAVPDLGAIAFHRDLGSLADKAGRVTGLLAAVAGGMGLEAALPVAAAAAALARADAATAVVREMPALGGVMGRHYALRDGVPAPVADAIYEAVLPRFAGDDTPASPAGAVLAVTDRLDSLVGLIAAGCAPTASADPYGLRRAAVGLLETLLSHEGGVPFDLRAAVSASAALQPIPVEPSSVEAATAFITRRLEQMLLDRGCGAEAVRAALAARGNDPAAAAAAAVDLDAELAAGPGGGSRLGAAVAALARPARLAKDAGGASASSSTSSSADLFAAVDPSLFEGEPERGLWAAATAARAALPDRAPVAAFIEAVAPLEAPVATFFEDVFVMCEDPAVRANRLALLRAVASLADGVAKLDELPGF